MTLEQACLAMTSAVVDDPALDIDDAFEQLENVHQSGRLPGCASVDDVLAVARELAGGKT